MPGGIAIPILSETKAYRQGLETGVIKPTEDAQKALDNLGKSRGPEQLERDLRDAQTASARLERETQETARAIEQNFREAYAQLRQSSATGTSRAKQDLDELGNEARSNLSETLSSFDGTAEGFADGIMGTLGGVVSALGPGGAVAATIGALGLGVFLADMQKAGEASDALKTKASDLARAWIEAGDTSAAGVQMLVDNLTELATTTDTALPNLERLRDIADRSGSSYRSLAQAYAGNTEGLKDLWRAADRRLTQLRDEAEAVDTTTRGGAEKYAQLIQQSDAQETYLGYLGQTLGVAREAAEAEANYAAAGGPQLEAKAQLIALINDAYDSAAGSIADYVNAETGVLDVQGYIDAMAARTQALADYQTNLANSALSPEARSFLNEQGAEAAAQFLAGYQGATDTQKAELNRIWTEAGKENSGEYSKSVKDTLPDRIDKRPTVQLEADTFDADREIDRFVNRVRTATVRVRLVDPTGRVIL